MKLPAVILLVIGSLLSSCERSPRALSEAELIGKWTLTELKTEKGHRGPADGILIGGMELKADGTCSAKLQWTKNATGNDPVDLGFRGTWALSDSHLIFRPGSTAPPATSKIWFEKQLLAIEPVPGPASTYYYVKAP